MKFRQQAGTRLRPSPAGQKLAGQTSFREVFSMRVLIAAALLATFAAAGPSLAADTAQQTAMKDCAAKWKGVSAADKAKTKYQDYMSSCMKAPAAGATLVKSPTMTMSAKPAGGSMAMKPAASGSMAMTAGKPGAMAPAAGGGQAKCKDGVIVTYKSRQGTCSGHKGVATWM
jgi:hypothetical protein